MPYALIAWDVPEGEDEQEIERQFFNAIRHGDKNPIKLNPRLFLHPRDDLGFTDIQRQIRPLIDATQNLHAWIIMPTKGNRVGGWSMLSDADRRRAARLMNKRNSSRMPMQLPREEREREA